MHISKEESTSGHLSANGSDKRVKHEALGSNDPETESSPDCFPSLAEMLRTTIVALKEMPPVHNGGPIFDESQN
ncbi:hypothetical protein E2C01_055956 [Portunus trituberculatus]|uniref:Uncharacterized protein n=1 Tax=Portunus trituberculatus TaxID=210409 RepID=A0A5B7GWL2_PORTR|nr:hypothetical protein [Portunus trituberculatus]